MSLSNPAIVIGVSAVDTAKDVLTGVDNKVRQTTQIIQTEGDKVNSKWAQVSSNFKQHMGSILTTAAGLGAGIVGFATSFDTLEKAQVRADTANLTLARSQEALKNVMANSKSTAEDIAAYNQKRQINATRLHIH